MESEHENNFIRSLHKFLGLFIDLKGLLKGLFMRVDTYIYELIRTLTSFDNNVKEKC